MNLYMLGLGGSLSLLAVLIGTIRAGMSSERARGKAYELVTNRRWLMNIIYVVLFCVYIMHTTKYDTTKEAMQVKEALKKAIIALVIANLAELGLTITPFWLVFVVAFYLEGWV